MGTVTHMADYRFKKHQQKVINLRSEINRNSRPLEDQPKFLTIQELKRKGLIPPGQFPDHEPEPPGAA